MRIIRRVLPIAGAVALVCALPIAAAAATGPKMPTGLTQAKVDACVKVLHSTSPITKQGRATCLVGDIQFPIPCPKGRTVTMFSGPTKDNTNYVLRVGHPPERATYPQGAAQIAYFCAHGTLIGAPQPYSS
jgi:hypothetical protein